MFFLCRCMLLIGALTVRELSVEEKIKLSKCKLTLWLSLHKIQICSSLILKVFFVLFLEYPCNVSFILTRWLHCPFFFIIIVNNIKWNVDFAMILYLHFRWRKWRVWQFYKELYIVKRIIINIFLLFVYNCCPFLLHSINSVSCPTDKQSQWKISCPLQRPQEWVQMSQKFYYCFVCECFNFTHNIADHLAVFRNIGKISKRGECIHT